MNHDLLEARWLQVREQSRKWWGKLTDDDLVKIGGNAGRLADALQDRYGYTRDNAESQSNRWMRDHQDTDREPTDELDEANLHRGPANSG